LSDHSSNGSEDSEEPFLKEKRIKVIHLIEFLDEL